MTHEELRELIPAYALDALTPEEAQGVEAHLPSCEECQRELALLREAAVVLATGVATQAPPPELRSQVLGAVQPRRGRLSTVPGRVPALAAAVLIVLLGGLSVSLYQRLSTVNARLKAQAQALALLADPSARSVILTGTAPGSARFVFDPARGRGVLVVSGLRDPGQEFVYQLWLVAGTVPRSAGVFRPAPGQPVVVPVGADFRQYQAVAISVERAPNGAARPTTTPVLTGAIAGPG